MEAKKQKCPKCKTIRYETDFEIKRLDMHYKTCKVCRSYEKKKDEPVVNENKQKCSNCKVVKDIIMFQGITGLLKLVKVVVLVRKNHI